MGDLKLLLQIENGLNSEDWEGEKTSFTLEKHFLRTAMFQLIGAITIVSLVKSTRKQRTGNMMKIDASWARKVQQ